MRLIDADALKEVFRERESYHSLKLPYDVIIDNAPTVDAYTEDDVKTAIKEGHEVGYQMAKAKFERPQGEWISDGDVHSKCSLCGFKYADYRILFDYCPNCGAKMIKEAER